jgi:S1-C subfamily serine protease
MCASEAILPGVRNPAAMRFGRHIAAPEAYTSVHRESFIGAAMRFSLALRSVLTAVALLLAPSVAPAQTLSLDELLNGVVRIKTTINPDGRTLQNLGREREGTGIVIDGNGLVLTIGYLMVEAYAAEVTTSDGRTWPANVLGYDYDTGFGLLQAVGPLKAKPLALGKSADLKENETVVVAGLTGPARALVVSKREFAGYW